MKTIVTPLLIGLTVASCSLAALNAAEAPKKLLVVTTTTGFRHSSIPTAEKVLSQLAAQSGVFTLEFVHQPPNEPAAPKAPAALKAGATEVAQAAFKNGAREIPGQSNRLYRAKAQWDQKMKDALSKLSPNR